MIIFLEKEGKLKCLSDVDMQTILFSISRYKYFYGKTLIIKRTEAIFNGVSLKYYEKNKSCQIHDVEVYNKLMIHKMELPKTKEEHTTPQSLLNLFTHEYEEKYEISYIINNKFTYLKKFRRLMDEFYKNELKDVHIRNYIKRCVIFGNYKGEPIYIDFMFNDKVLQNYLLFVKGIKDIDAVWPYLDTTLSNLERKKIRYLMNLKLIDTFKQVEIELCLKFYKKYNKKLYYKLIEQHKTKNNINSKEVLFELIKKDYNMTTKELLKKTKHEKEYFSYEYTKKQIKEVFE